jgi:hypothetical protein
MDRKLCKDLLSCIYCSMTTRHGFVPKHQVEDLTVQAFNCIWDSWGGHLRFIPNGVQKHIR